MLSRVYVFTLLFVLYVFSCFISPHVVMADERHMLVLDISGSMWGQIEGKSKIEIAREAVSSLMDVWPETAHVGIVAYGHRRKGDCGDIETVLPLGPLNREQVKKVVNSLTPRGMTPLSASVRHAAEELKFTEHKATVILVSDGIENCNMDPCDLGKELNTLGVDFTAHVIGFDVSEMDQSGLKCLAESTGGVYPS
jgi:Ca-activated chloride channel homolog